MLAGPLPRMPARAAREAVLRVICGKTLVQGGHDGPRVDGVMGWGMKGNVLPSVKPKRKRWRVENRQKLVLSLTLGSGAPICPRGSLTPALRPRSDLASVAS